MELEKITDSRIKKLAGKELNIIVNDEKYSGKLKVSEDNSQLIYRKDPITIVQILAVNPNNLFKQNGSLVLADNDSNNMIYYYTTSLHYKEFDKFLKGEDEKQFDKQ